MNKYFLSNPEKYLTQIHQVIFKKNAKDAPLFPKNDIIELKARNC